MGWSQGGGITLLTIERRSSDRPTPPPAHDFKAAVSFYPGMCSERRQSIPFTNAPRGKWSTQIPLIVLHGSADNWTLPKPCQRFIDAARERGEPVSFRLYPGARHSFDTPNSRNRTVKRITLKNGQHPTIGTHPESRRDVLKRVPAFFAQHLKL
jgi:dienelactone hydrolase